MHSCVSRCTSLVGLGYVCETISGRRISSQKKLYKLSSTNLSQCLQICVSCLWLALFIASGFLVSCLWLALFLAFGWPSGFPGRETRMNPRRNLTPSQAQPACPAVCRYVFLAFGPHLGYQGLPYSRASYIGHIATRLFSLVATCKAGAGGYRGRDIDRFIDVYMRMHTFILSTFNIYVLLLSAQKIFFPEEGEWSEKQAIFQKEWYPKPNSTKLTN